MERTAPWLAQVKIRTIRKSDLPAMEWDGEYTHFRRVYAEAFERTKSGRTIIWIAELDGKVIGQLFVQLMCDPETANADCRSYIYSFRIREPWRSGGLGTMMMETVERYLYDRGYVISTLNVAQTNHDAMRLYERLGYEVVGTDPGRWSYPDEKGTWHLVEEPAWRMEKRLTGEY